MIQLLKNCIVKQTTDEDADEGVKDLVDITLKKMDKDHDGRLSFSDYKLAVKVRDSLSVIVVVVVDRDARLSFSY